MMKVADDFCMKLRALEPEDLEFLYTIENDRDLWDVGNTNVPYSKFSLNNYLVTCESDIYADKQMRLVMEDAYGEAVGLLDIFNFDPRHLRAEIGIAVTRKVRNHGYGSEALRVACDYAKTILHLHQLYAIVDVENIASMKSFQEAGFKEGAALKDWIYDGMIFHDAVMMQKFL